MEEIKSYRYLPVPAMRIRENVFVEEQGFLDEFDDMDYTATHLVLYYNTISAATCRFYPFEEEGAYILGRIAVVKEFRGKGLGMHLIQEAENKVKEAGGTRVLLAAQTLASGFYEKQGYTAFGDIFFDEHCPHIWMRKLLV